MRPTTYYSMLNISQIMSKVEKCFDQSGHLFTNNSTNQITGKTIDFEDSTAQEPRKWRKNAKAVAKIAFRVLFFWRKHVNYLVPFLYFSNL